MCIQNIRICTTCGWRRPYYYDKCILYRVDERESCLQGKRCYHPSECEDTIEFNEVDKVWVFKYPPLQCDNPECPDLPFRDALWKQLQDERDRIAREIEEARRLREEMLQRKRDIFAAKYFIKRPILSIEQQDEILGEKEQIEKDQKVAQKTIKKMVAEDENKRYTPIQRQKRAKQKDEPRRQPLPYERYDAVKYDEYENLRGWLTETDLVLSFGIDYSNCTFI